MQRHLRALLLAAATTLAVLPGRSDAQGTGFRADSGSSELVVVLHGMGRTPRSMATLARAIENAGFDVLNVGYSSYCCSIAELADSVRAEIQAKRLPRHTRVHFVGHSLGGIIARSIVTHAPPPAGVGRLVMLASPNQGSSVADRFAGVADWLLEPVDELRTDSTATVKQLPSFHGVEVGVIAASSDWAVSLEESHVAGEVAHTVVESGHTFIMRRAEVHRLTIAFLKTGRFPEDAKPAPESAGAR